MVSEPILPAHFKERYSQILGERNKEFLKYCALPIKKVIRINTLKVEDVLAYVKELNSKGWNLERIPWCDYAFAVSDVEPGKTYEYFLGKIYVQEAASLIPSLALNPDEHDFVLDMASAPGSKTTHLAQIMNNKGCIVANDVSYKRLRALGFNIELTGALNVVVAEGDATRIHADDRFDKILIDAPCSCEGTVRKDWKALSKWNPRMCRFMAQRQKQMLRVASKALKKGGIIVYSTCTLSPEENEGVVDFALRNLGLEIEKIELKGLKRSECVTEWEGQQYDERVKSCLRLWPQDNDTEGFFVARLKKI
jgi:NOL1/NOP2/sun family putative RNA methylase